jgi:hypothetical protein
MGGSLLNSDDYTTRMIVAFDGSAFSNVALEEQGSSHVGAFAFAVVDDDHLAVGGSFTAAGDRAASNFAFFNGTAWTGPVNDAFGFDKSVSAMLYADSSLYVGGAMKRTLPDGAPIGGFTWLSI